MVSVRLVCSCYRWNPELSHREAAKSERSADKVSPGADIFSCRRLACSIESLQLYIRWSAAAVAMCDVTGNSSDADLGLIQWDLWWWLMMGLIQLTVRWLVEYSSNKSTVYFIYYSAPVGERIIAISLSVCASVCVLVCPRAYLCNRWPNRQEIWYADPLWPWLGPPLAALRYLVYFRFYGWRHVWPYWAVWRCVASCVTIPWQSLMSMYLFIYLLYQSYAKYSKIIKNKKIKIKN